MKRRKFLSWFGFGWLVSFASASLTKIATAAIPTKKPTFVQAGTVESLTKMGSLAVTVQGKSITVFPNPTNPKQLLAMNLACTHNGCKVNWNREEKSLLCPCHGSKFDLTGKVLQAPAEKPLASYPVLRRGKNILVQVN